MLFPDFEKVAISAGKTLALLQARAAGGARVAPKLMQQAQGAASAGAASTPAHLRRLALGAGQEARGVQAAARLEATTAQKIPHMAAGRERLQGGYEKAVSSPSSVRDAAAPRLTHATDHGATGMSGATQPYSKAHLNSIAGPASPASPELLQHDALTARLRNIKSLARTRATAGGPAGARAGTQSGLVGGRTVDPLGPTAVTRAPASVSASNNTVGTAVARRTPLPRVA
jgi:hypothetical protein